eukprot:3191367-Amphidinium_carterae.1
MDLWLHTSGYTSTSACHRTGFTSTAGQNIHLPRVRTCPYHGSGYTSTRARIYTYMGQDLHLPQVRIYIYMPFQSQVQGQN